MDGSSSMVVLSPNGCTISSPVSVPNHELPILKAWLGI